MIDFLNGPTGFCGNHQGLGGTYYTVPTAIGATGHGSNTNQSGSVENKPTINPGPPMGFCGNHQGLGGTYYTVPTAIGATGHGSNTNQSGSVENKPTIKPNAPGKPAEEKKAITDLYMSDGDDYYIDDTALSNAQMETGDNETADSVVGSGGDGSETNSNINTGVFGGSSRAAHPGYSLW